MTVLKTFIRNGIEKNKAINPNRNYSITTHHDACMNSVFIQKDDEKQSFLFDQGQLRSSI